MFWDKGYTPSQNIEALLEKENATLEEFLDDDDVLQECKTQKKTIVNYFNRPDVIKRLVEYVTTIPSDDLPLAQRFRYANMSCEILTLGVPSLDEKLLSDPEALKTLYSYLENEPPLNPLLSSFFSKTFSSLFAKKPDQDWFLYQKMCLQLLEYIKSQNNFLELICKHFSTPVIPDLIMQMMRDIEGGQLKRNLYEWLTEDKLVERLIIILGDAQQCDKHANVAEFLCDLIHQGRGMRQTEQENDSFEPAFDGSNPILKTIESEANIEALLNVILEPNAEESAIISGITVLLMLIRSVVLIEEPNSDRLKFIQQRELEIHEQILETVIRVIAPRLREFNELLQNPPTKPSIVTTVGTLDPPFGITRLQICRVFTVLLQTKNTKISKAICETDFFDTLLGLFKLYCWNSFLHSEVEKCIETIFYPQLSNNNSTQSSSTNDNNGSYFNKNNNNVGKTPSVLDLFLNAAGNGNTDTKDEQQTDGPPVEAASSNEIEASNVMKSEVNENSTENKNDDDKNDNKKENKIDNKGTSAGTIEGGDSATELPTNITENNTEMNIDEDENKENDDPKNVTFEGDATNDNDSTQMYNEIYPSHVQKHLIVNCKLISKLMDCWQYNKESENADKSRRLGYMGHLIKILKHIVQAISESEHIGALIESSLRDEAEVDLWQSIIDENDGDFTKALAKQSKMLADCNANEAADFSQHLPKEFLNESSSWDCIMAPNMLNDFSVLNETSTNELVFALEQEMYHNDMILDNDENNFIQNSVDQFIRNIDNVGEEDEDINALIGRTSQSTTSLQTFGVTNNPWDNLDPFNDLSAPKSNTTTVGFPWASEVGSDNFADFDSHFSTFSNDLGESLSVATKQSNQNIFKPDFETAAKPNATNINEEEVDNNANVEQQVSLASNETTTCATPDEALKRRAITPDTDDDDYEDDEGMWTKPLGSSGQQDTEITAELPMPTIIVPNGPSRPTVDDEELEKLNDLMERITLIDITTAPIFNDTQPTENAASAAEIVGTDISKSSGDMLNDNATKMPQTEHNSLDLEEGEKLASKAIEQIGDILPTRRTL